LGEKWFVSLATLAEKLTSSSVAATAPMATTATAVQTMRERKTRKKKGAKAGKVSINISKLAKEAAIQPLCISKQRPY
jgi:hypothetical protein